MNNKYNLKINGDNNLKNEEVVVIMAGKKYFQPISEPHKLRSPV
jgi:hypothetical protein